MPASSNSSPGPRSPRRLAVDLSRYLDLLPCCLVDRGFPRKGSRTGGLGMDMHSKPSGDENQAMKRWTVCCGMSVTALVPCILAGVLLGTGAFTVHYAEGFSYLSNDPKACVN